MDQFYQDLRKIQKKERNNATLAHVEETFYSDIHEYMDKLKTQAMRDPLSNVPAKLKEAQIIATEICERREHKITDAAVVNIHRSYHLFIGKPQFDLVDTTPLNLTPEEEKFYFSLIDTLRNHRGNISLDKLSDDEDISSNKKVIKPSEPQTNTLTSAVEKKEEVKPIKKETPKAAEKKVPKPPETVPVENIEENPNQEEFYDFESKKIARDTELITMLVFDEIGPIVGVDEKVYGPFRPQDIVTLPLINAKIFFKNRKGRQVKI